MHSSAELRALAYTSRIAYVSYAWYITSLHLRPLRSTAQRLVDSSNTYVQQPLTSSRDITLRLFFHRHPAYDQFYVSAILQALPEAACLRITLLRTSKEPIIVRQYSLLAAMLNPKNNLVPISNRRRQLIPGELNLLVLALTPKGKPSGLKDHYGLNKIDPGNILSFINYTTMNK